MKIWIKVDSGHTRAFSVFNAGLQNWIRLSKKGRIPSVHQGSKYLKWNFSLNKYWDWIVLGRNFFESVSGFFSQVYLLWYRGTHRTKWHLIICQNAKNEGKTTKAYILYNDKTLRLYHIILKVKNLQGISSSPIHKKMIYPDPRLESTANLYCNFVHMYWEGCVICSVYMR